MRQHAAAGRRCGFGNARPEANRNCRNADQGRHVRLRRDPQGETPGMTDTRRDFGKIALGGTALLAKGRSASATVHNSQPGIKLCAQSSAKASDDELRFLKQIGADYVSVRSTPDLRTADGFM